jgi:hypothetical protein
MSELHVSSSSSVQAIVTRTILDQRVAAAVSNMGKLGLQVIQMSTSPAGRNMRYQCLISLPFHNLLKPYHVLATLTFLLAPIYQMTK